MQEVSSATREIPEEVCDSSTRSDIWPGSKRPRILLLPLTSAKRTRLKEKASTYVLWESESLSWIQLWAWSSNVNRDCSHTESNSRILTLRTACVAKRVAIPN